jgi:thiamine-phosphate pyrophosphorylase
MSIREARELLGPDRLIGISTHNIEQARAAQRDGADYIGVGPVYPTGTKPGRAAVTTGYVRQAAAEITIPFVAIGGITTDNADEVLAAGAKRLCAVSAVVGSVDPAGVCRALLEKIHSFHGDRDSIVRITVNGKETLAPVSTVDELVSRYGLESNRIVVELDGVILRREEWGRITLRAGAQLELVHFVGGG